MPSPLNPDVLALVAINLDRRLDAVRLERLHGRYGTLAAIARRVAGPSFASRAQAELARAAAIGVAVTTPLDGDYPELLRQVPDHPAVLYVRGALTAADDPAIAIVGARRATPEGRRVARHLAERIAGRGLTIVSGLARGIDGEAHQGALAATGRTVAVLACGLDRVYPAEHRHLAREVAGAGAVLSEFPLGTRPLRHQFPVRNRLIAGLARAVVVIEAAEKSGSLGTARVALDYDRDVLAVPGSPLSAAHRGSNRLLRAGARVVLEPEDVLDALPRDLQPPPLAPAAGHPLQSEPALTDTEIEMLARLSLNDPMSVDQLAEKSGLSAAQVSATLVALELKEVVAVQPGSKYLRLLPMRELDLTAQHRLQPPVLSSDEFTPTGAG